MSDKLFRVVWKTSGEEYTDRGIHINQDGELFEYDCDGEDNVSDLYDRDWSTGFSDRDGTPIFENDLVDYSHPYMTNSDGSREILHGVVEWCAERGMWIIRRNEAWYVLLYKHAKTSKVTGRKQ